MKVELAVIAVKGVTKASVLCYRQVQAILTDANKWPSLSINTNQCPSCLILKIIDFSGLENPNRG